MNGRAADPPRPVASTRVTGDTAASRSRAPALSWPQRRFFFVLALPAFGISLAYTIVTAYVPVLLDDLSGPTTTGALIGAEGLIALIVPALIGGWSDRSSSRIGSRLPFILVGAALTSLSLILMPLGDDSLTWVALCLVAFFIAYFVYYAPYYALYPDLVPYEVRGRSQGFQGALRSAGLLLAMGTGGLMLSAWRELPFVASAAVVLAVTLALFSQLRGNSALHGHQVATARGFAGTLEFVRGSVAVRRFRVSLPRCSCCSHPVQRGRTTSRRCRIRRAWGR